jgi:hypothetical protein
MRFSTLTTITIASDAADAKTLNTTTTTADASNADNDDDDDASETASLEIGACCLCHCALDYSDRAAFFKEDRHEDYKQQSPTKKSKQLDDDDSDSGSDSDSENNSQDNDDDGSKAKDNEDNNGDENGNDGNKNEDIEMDTRDDEPKSPKAGGNDVDKVDDAVSEASSEYFFRPDDPYIAGDSNLYDAHNALVYCDTEGCNRMYHQKCHFVPVLTLPRGAWHCLICTCHQAAAATMKKRKKKAPKKAKTPPKSSKKAVAGKGKAGAAGAVLESTTTKGDDNDEEQQLQILLKTEDLFRSPPIAAARAAELQWEYASRNYKAAAWRAELHQRLKQAVSSQTGNYRLGVMAAETLTSTQKNRRHFSKHGGSQELAQSLVKLFGAKFKMREFCHNLEKVRRSSGKSWQRLQKWTDEWLASTSTTDKIKNDFVERVLFPFGRQHPIRMDPRTPEMKLAQIEQASAADANKDPKKIAGVPDEIILVSTTSAATAGLGADKKGKEKGSKAKKGAPSSKSACPATGVGSKKVHTAGKKCPGDAKHDDDSGISLDDLKCCVCHQGTATDDNDLILCDGSGCYRAYHMQCCKPEITAQDLKDEFEDWFCPICSCLADLLLLVQGEYMGDEWEQRRYGLQLDGKETTGSVKSWDAVDDVFPESEWEYETACMLKEGKCNTATKQLLAQVLGLDSLPVDEDHDDVEEDAHFDPSTFDVERRRARDVLEEEEADDDSSHSSQATLADMASVELEIGKDELAALSEPEDEDEDDNEQESENGSVGQVRRSRRIRKHDSNVSSDGDPGRFDESNIVQGKRGRKPVDYKKLNEAIFGDLPDAEAANIDDTDDFEIKETRKKVLNSSDDESGEEDDDDEKKDEDEDEQKPGASEEEPPHKKSRKHDPPTEEEDDSSAPKGDRTKTAKAANSRQEASSSTTSPRSSGTKGQKASPSITQAALNMVSKLVGGGREGSRRKR